MAKLEIEIDPVTCRFIEGDYRNIILVANNLEITADSVSKLEIAPSDVVVQFNRAPLFDILASYSCHKVHIFNANGDGSYWGFTKQGEAERDYLVQTAESFSFCFSTWLSNQAKSFINSLPGSALGGILSEGYLPPHFHYPTSKGPSVGFQTVCHFKIVNSLRILRKKRPLNLTLFGFSGQYPKSQSPWDGHDFNFEQSVYKIWLELVRLDHHGEPIKT